MLTNIHVIGVSEENERREKYFFNNHHKFSKFSEKYRSTDTESSRNPEQNKRKENHK